MRRHLAWLALPLLALACFVAEPTISFAHGGGGHGGGGHGGGGGHYGGGGFGHGYGGYGGYGGRGFGYGGLGYGGFGYGGLGFGGLGLGYGGYGGYGLGYGGYGYGGYGGYSPYYNSSPYYYNSTPVFTDPYAAVPATSYQSLYPSNMVAQQPVDTSRATIHVEVPSDAQVLFNNAPTQQTGTERTFVSPQLEPNQKYSYEVTAEWTQNGQSHRESRTVRVIPGQTADVNFMVASTDANRIR